MSTVNYLLLFQGYSNHGGHESKVRCFAKLEAARDAMEKAYRRLAASMDIPIRVRTPSNRYTVRMDNSIRLERNGEWFQWEIVKAIPEDESDSIGEGSQGYGLKKYTVVIMDHIMQGFPVEAYNIFHALRIAEEQYKRGSLAAKSSRRGVRLMMARDIMTGETTEWKEF